MDVRGADPGCRAVEVRAAKMKNSQKYVRRSPAILSDDRIECPQCHVCVVNGLLSGRSDKIRLAWFGQAVILRFVRSNGGRPR